MPDPIYESPTPFVDARIQAAALYCSDGRIGEQMDELLHERLELPRCDRLVVPGGAACLAGHWPAYWEARGVEEQLRFLIEAHDLRRVILIAHEGCAYYAHKLRLPASAALLQQRKDLAKAALLVRRLDDRVTIETYFARLKDGRVCFEVA
jgi:hypothetical protein